MIKKVIGKIKAILRRIKNNKNRYDYETQFGWEKSDIVLGNKEYSYFDPYILVRDSKIKLYVSKRVKNEIVVVDFENNIFSNEKLVLSPIDNTWENKVNRGCVVFAREKYWLWYTGQFQGKSKIGLATSEDGLVFLRCEKNPILEANLDFEGKSVMNPCVLYDELSNSFMMWYSCGDDYEPDSICFATSNDGVSWIKKGYPVFEHGFEEYNKFKVGGCDVLKTSKGFIMYYIGYQNLDVTRICKAFSVKISISS